MDTCRVQAPQAVEETSRALAKQAPPHIQDTRRAMEKVVLRRPALVDQVERAKPKRMQVLLPPADGTAEQATDLRMDGPFLTPHQQQISNSGQ